VIVAVYAVPITNVELTIGDHETVAVNSFVLDAVVTGTEPTIGATTPDITGISITVSA
jgi:hypothetical protein